jgi:DNA-directed RNA polymerase
MELNIDQNKQEIYIKSMMWNSVIEVFKNEKNIDITKYMVSIQLRWKTVLVKTNKPIINTEAILLDDKIKKVFSEKIKSIWIKFYDFELKYL